MFTFPEERLLYRALLAVASKAHPPERSRRDFRVPDAAPWVDHRNSAHDCVPYSVHVWPAGLHCTLRTKSIFEQYEYAVPLLYRAHSVSRFLSVDVVLPFLHRLHLRVRTRTVLVDVFE